MTDKTPHPFADFTRRVVRSLTTVSAGLVCGAALTTSVGFAQDGEPFDFASEGPSRKYVTPASAESGPISPGGPAAGGDTGASGMGIGARLGHIAGNTVGRDSSLTHVELMPYSIVGETMLFGDIRAWRTNDDGLGGNFGLGVRRFLPEWNKVLGANVWYDLDDSLDVQFEQLGFGLELLGENWDVRSNWYRPINDLTQSQDPRVVPNSARFEGYRVLFTQSVETLAAAQGVDWMLTVPVRGEFFRKIDMEVGAGAYWFDSTDVSTDALWGWRLRADAGFFQEVVHTFTELNVDDQTGTGVTFGVSLDYHGGLDVQRRLGRSQKNRMGEWVRRNYNVVALNQPVITSDVQALNPADGEPYFIAHVDNVFQGGQLRAPASDGGPRPVLDPARAAGFVDGAAEGTFENPFGTILDAQNFLGDEEVDIIYVATGTEFDSADFENGSLVIADDTRLFGEGLRSQNAFDPGLAFADYQDLDLVVQHPVPVVGSDDFLILPSPTLESQFADGTATATNTLRPVLTGLPGTAVTVGDNVEFRGFIIDGVDPDNPAATVSDTGLLASGVNSGTYEDLFFTQLNGDGIFLQDSAGLFVMNNVQIGAVSGLLGLQSPTPLIGFNPDEVGDDVGLATGADGIAFHVEGGTPSVRVDGFPFGAEGSPAGVGSLIANANDYAVLIDGTTGGRVNLSNFNIVDVGGSGIRVRDNFGDALFANALLINNTVAPGELELPGTPFAVLRSAGTTTIASGGTGLRIGNPAEDAIVVEDLAATGEVLSQPGAVIIVDHTPIGADPVAATGQLINDVIGLRMTNVAGLVELSGSIDVLAPDIDDDGRAFALTQPAIVFEASSGAALISNVTVRNRGGGGIRVGDPTGLNVNAAGSLFELSGSSTFDRVGWLDIGLLNIPTDLNANIAHIGTEANPELSRFQGTGVVQITDRGSVGLKVRNVVAPGRTAIAGSITMDDDGDFITPSAVEITDNEAIVTVGLVQINDSLVNDNVVEINRNNRTDPDDTITDATVSIRDLQIFDADLDSAVAGVNNQTGGVRDITGITIFTHAPSGVMIADNDDVQISDGVIETVDGRALTAVNNLNTVNDGPFGQPFLRFESISADDAGAAAVFLSLNRGEVDVTGVSGINDSGGTIQDSGDAYRIVDHDGVISLNQINSDANTRGIALTNFDPNQPFVPSTTGPVVLDPDDEDFDNSETQLFVDNSSFTDNGQGIVATNLDTLDVQTSVFDDFVFEAIDVLITELNDDDLVYDYVIDDSVFDDGVTPGAGIINIVADAGGDSDTLLNLDVTSSILDGSPGNERAVFVDWDGSTDILIANNLIETGSPVDQDPDLNALDRPNQGAIDLRVGDDNDGNFSDIEIRDNDDGLSQGIVQENSFASAVFIELGGLGDVDIIRNRMTHTDFDNVVVRLGYDIGGTTTSISDNVFTFQDGGAAILVEDSEFVTNIGIDANLFNAGNIFFTFDDEFILIADDPITISGNGNLANGAGLIFVEPGSIANITGQFQVNGNLFP